MIGPFGRLLMIKKGEHRKVLLSVVLLFLTTANLVAIRSARDSLILAKAEIDVLPLLYVVSAFFLVLASWSYSLAAKALRRRTLLYILYLSSAVALFALYFVAIGRHDWFPVFFYVFGEVIVILASLQGWSYICEQFDTRQGKRLFGLISAGGILSGACGGFGIQLFTKVFAAEALLIFGALVLVFAAWAVYGLASVSVPEPAGEPARQKGEAAGSEGMVAALLSNRYLLALTAIFVLTGMGTSFCDYIFKVTVRHNFGGSGAEMASFFGFFYGISNSIMLFYSLFFSGRVLSRLGVGGASMALPVEILIGCLFFFISPGLLAASILKFGDTGVRYTLHNSALNLAMMPFSPARRANIKTFTGGIVRPVAGGLAGLVLMALAAYWGAENISPYLIALFGMGMIWIAVTAFLKKGYLRTLYESLEKRRIDPAELSAELADELTVGVLERELDSTDKYRVLYAMDFLDEIRPERLQGMYSDLLKKTGSSEVLAELLPRIEKLADPRFFDDLEEKSREFPSLEGLFARAMAASDRNRASNYIETLVSRRGSCPELLIAMIRYMGDDFALQARRQCRRLAKSDRKEEREMAAAIIAEAGFSVLELEDVLWGLIKDRSAGIRKLAIQAVAETNQENFPLDNYWPAVLDPATGTVAAVVLKKVPDSASFLQNRFGKSLSHQEKLALISALGIIRSPDSIDFICGQMAQWELSLRRRGAVTLSRIRQNFPDKEFPRQIIEAILVREIGEAFLVKALALKAAEADAVRSLLEKEAEVRLEIIFRCLGLLFKQEEVFRSYLNISQGKKTTNAIEYLDSMADWPGKSGLISLLESDSSSLIMGYTAITGRPVGDLPEELVGINDRVLQGLGLYLAESRLSLADELLRSEHIEVVEAAVLHVDRFDGKNFNEKGFYAGFIRNKEAAMLSTIERILFLRGVSLFGGLSGELLLHLAKSSHEEEFGEGSVIVAEDTLEDRNLYVIIEGEVAVSKGGKEIALLNEKRCFGEMALLDNKPRSASATAKTDCRCLAVGHDDLKELIAENSGIALGIIEVLSERLREMLADRLY